MIDEGSIGVRLGARLREARLQAGLTVREVADRIGLKHAIIVKYENGAIVPSIARLQTLARLYGLTAAGLLAEHDHAVQLFASLDQASVEQIEHIAQLVRDGLSA